MKTPELAKALDEIPAKQASTALFNYVKGATSGVSQMAFNMPTHQQTAVDDYTIALLCIMNSTVGTTVLGGEYATFLNLVRRARDKYNSIATPQRDSVKASISLVVRTWFDAYGQGTP